MAEEEGAAVVVLGSTGPLGAELGARVKGLLRGGAQQLPPADDRSDAAVGGRAPMLTRSTRRRNGGGLGKPRTRTHLGGDLSQVRRVVQRGPTARLRPMTPSARDSVPSCLEPRGAARRSTSSLTAGAGRASSGTARCSPASPSGRTRTSARCRPRSVPSSPAAARSSRSSARSWTLIHRSSGSSAWRSLTSSTSASGTRARRPSGRSSVPCSTSCRRASGCRTT